VAAIHETPYMGKGASLASNAELRWNVKYHTSWGRDQKQLGGVGSNVEFLLNEYGEGKFGSSSPKTRGATGTQPGVQNKPYIFQQLGNVKTQDFATANSTRVERIDLERDHEGGTLESNRGGDGKEKLGTFSDLNWALPIEETGFWKRRSQEVGTTKKDCSVYAKNNQYREEKTTRSLI